MVYLFLIYGFVTILSVSHAFYSSIYTSLPVINTCFLKNNSAQQSLWGLCTFVIKHKILDSWFQMWPHKLFWGRSSRSTTDNFKRMFGTHVKTQSKWFMALVHNCWRNMYSSQHIKDQRTVKTVGFRRQICAREGNKRLFWRFRTRDLHSAQAWGLTLPVGIVGPCQYNFLINQTSDQARQARAVLT